MITLNQILSPITPQTQSTPGITISRVIVRSQATSRSQPNKVEIKEGIVFLDQKNTIQIKAIKYSLACAIQQISLLFKPLKKSSVSQMRRRFRTRLESEPFLTLLTIVVECNTGG